MVQKKRKIASLELLTKSIIDFPDLYADCKKLAAYTSLF